jgi:hypothetical protein
MIGPQAIQRKEKLGLVQDRLEDANVKAVFPDFTQTVGKEFW